MQMLIRKPCDEDSLKSSVLPCGAMWVKKIIVFFKSILIGSTKYKPQIVLPSNHVSLFLLL